LVPALRAPAQETTHLGERQRLVDATQRIVLRITYAATANAALSDMPTEGRSRRRGDALTE
jgi:hypothetical protein